MAGKDDDVEPFVEEPSPVDLVELTNQISSSTSSTTFSIDDIPPSRWAISFKKSTPG